MTSFWNNLAAHANNVALLGDGGERLTYAELERAADELQTHVGRRCLVFCLCENSPGSMLGYVSCLRHGVVPLLLAKDLDRALLQRLLDLYRPEFLYVPQAMVDRFPGFAVRHVGFRYALLQTDFADPFPLHGDLALLLTTSGSTGSPKLVRQSYRNLDSNAQAIAQYLELDATERPITTLAMSYTYGLSIVNSHLRVGATLLVTAKTLVEKGFWDFFKSAGATSFGGVPYTYEMLKKLRFFRMELPTLRTLTQAGGKLAPELAREVAEYAAHRNVRFFVMYGQTEATARMAFLPPELALAKCGSMGMAIPGGRFELVDADGARIEGPAVPGELVYHGPNVALGYAERGEDLAKGDEWGGVLATGDVARRDADGFYYVVGRKKRFLKIFGNRVNLDETERMLKDRFDGLDCACAGVDDRMTVYLAEAGAERAREVLDFLAAKTGLNPVAFAVQAVPRIPKNEAGKTLYAELENMG